MFRNFQSIISRCTDRPIIVTISRHVRGAAPSSASPEQPSAQSFRFGYGVRRLPAVSEDKIRAETASSQRLASFYGHPRFPPKEDDAEWMKTAESSFNQIEQDEPVKRRKKAPEPEEDILDDQSFPSSPPGELGQFEPLDRPVPAPRRKPRAFLQTYTLTTLVNDSELLRNLVDIGVKVEKFDALYNVADWLLKLDWDKDVRPVLRFLTEVGVPVEELGDFVTTNPWILQQSITDMEARIRYLESKKFSKQSVARIVNKARFWLNFHVKTIDKRLGWLQTTFQLSGDEIRFVVSCAPKLITIGTGYIQLLQFAVKDEMGFNEKEMHELMVKDPKLWTADKHLITRSFDYLHNTMKFSHKDILVYPSVLRVPPRRIRERHEYLKSLGRDQYDPTQPNYVSLAVFDKCGDVKFATDIAKTSIAEYNKFLKKY